MSFGHIQKLSASVCWHGTGRRALMAGGDKHRIGLPQNLLIQHQAASIHIKMHNIGGALQ